MKQLLVSNPRNRTGAEQLVIHTPNDTSAKRQMRQPSYAKRNSETTPNDTGNTRQTTQESRAQLTGIIQDFAAVLCTYLPMYRWEL